MNIIYKNCCGLDVHKSSVTACIIKTESNGTATKEFKKFSTITTFLLEMSDWMKSNGVTHVAMESTGVYWKPVWNILEGNFKVILVNAQNIKQVPGRKTDMKDCEWIAELLGCGLLPSSFVPPAEIRELRDLTRQRTKMVQDMASIKNRIQKVLEDANVKISSVVTDIMGISGRTILSDISEGNTDPALLAEHAKRRLRGKIPELRLALVPYT